MFNKRTHWIIAGIWLGWAVFMLVFQGLIQARFGLKPPDYALEWTDTETMPGSQDDKIYLNEPFLNAHVSWDSEFYLSIAVGGYEDPDIRRLNIPWGDDTSRSGPWPFVVPASAGGVHQGISLSYAFFPFYPFMIRILSVPLSLIGLSSIATASLAGVLISLVGTLLGMLALFELVSDELGEDGGLRAAFYLIIFPSGFFLAQIYTEGLFVGLAGVRWIWNGVRYILKGCRGKRLGSL
jgi:hypothetical protein